VNFKKFSAAVGVAALFGVSGGAYAAANATFNPSAANGDAANKTVFAGQGAFTFNSIQTSLASQLDINGVAGSGVGWQESGSLIFNTYNGGLQYQGNRTYGGGAYDVYGIFTGAGTGNWVANQFTVTGISGFTIKLYASPATGTALTAGTPTSGTQANGGVTAGSKDFLLGTASFAGSFGGTNAQLNSDGTATTQLTASFNFVPASAAYTGIGGFFQAPTPFNLTLSASGSSNSFQSVYTVDGTGVHLVTAAGGGATGNIRLINNVPEPTALSLAGLALVGAAVASRKKKTKSA
jgi:hypothetical protein